MSKQTMDKFKAVIVVWIGVVLFEFGWVLFGVHEDQMKPLIIYITTLLLGGFGIVIFLLFLIYKKINEV